MNERLEHAAVLLAKTMTDGMLTSIAAEWGQTNAAVLRYYRKEVLEAGTETRASKVKENR